MTSLDIYLARHGDTFAPGQKVVWAGSRNDLPLAPRGLEQATALGEAFRRRGIALRTVVTGPLERTRVFAQRALTALGTTATPTIDRRLDEIDYGSWSGLSNNEVIERFGQRELERWNALSIWPKDAGWGSDEATITAEIQTLIRELVAHQEGPALLVSSNGRLRYTLTLVEKELERRVRDQTFKIKTGHLAHLRWDGERFSLPFWNISAEEFATRDPYSSIES
jgi:probable phosphoglycerate mutase